jgi:hypothetical protein
MLERGESIADLVRLLMGTRPHVVLWGRNKATRLALAVAIQKRTSAEVIELLLEYSPSKILTTSVRRGKSPSVLAVESSSSREVIVEMLLSLSPPDVLSVPDKRGKIPSHYIQRSTSADTSTVEALAQRFSEMLLTPDLRGKLPIHYAIHRGVRHEVVKISVEHCPAYRLPTTICNYQCMRWDLLLLRLNSWSSDELKLKIFSELIRMADCLYIGM